MVSMSSTVWIALLVMRFSTALQVTPDSPCSDFCLDSDDLDVSDPNSSNTKSQDVVCSDFEFSSEKAGKKYQTCMTCLQQSTFAKGTESDLDWFLYNLRYSFDVCVFGDFDAAGLDSSPCVTSEGCGRLTNALRHDIVNLTDRAQYGYCEEDDHAISSDAFDKCFSCVSAESTSSYISNFLIALGIACEQRPAPGSLLGLNSTVFTKNTIQAIDPADISLDNDPKAQFPLSTTAIAGIAVGGFVVTLLALGCIYMQYRKRKNKHRVSGWSFRCRNLSGTVPPRDEEDEKRRRFHEAMEKKMWTSPSEKCETGRFPEPPASTMVGNGKGTDQQQVITPVTMKVPQPPVIQTSGRYFHQAPSQEEYAAPVSATSVRSNRPLLRDGSPASYSARSYGHQGSVGPGQRGTSPQTPYSGGGGARWESPTSGKSDARPLTGSRGDQREGAYNFSTTFPPPPSVR